MKRVFLILLCLLAGLSAWIFWSRSGALSAKKSAVTPSSVAVSTGATNNLAVGKSGKSSAASTNRFAFRLSNTKKSLNELIHDQRAILLQNAFIDTTLGTAGLNIPDKLKSKGDPGVYIVQSRGPISAAFRAALQSAGGQVVSYIPNNAYLVQMSASSAGMLSANSLVQAVLPYEPYYKLQPSLLALAAQDEPLTPGTALTLGLFSIGAAQTEAQLVADGYRVVSTDVSPFGPVLRVVPPSIDNWIQAATVPGVQYMGKGYLRQPANDLARVTLGISTNTTTSANWLGLSGANVMVDVNDSGIDAQHPDFGTRVFGDFANSLTDTNGHGTHVAGIIAGSGLESSTVTTPPQGSVSGADFRGKAPAANLFSVGNIYGGISDQYLQEEPALTNALISNNSWVYGGDTEYDLAAASYDAATRDALPTRTGAQPVLFVFAAGDDGSGGTDGTGGNEDSIESPGTAKNVITVGGLEQLRDITNIVTVVTDGVTNASAIWEPETDSGTQVADYSARGNVGVNTEGAFGRFKPDVVAPGSWVVSTSSGFNDEWDTNAYYNPTNVTAIYYGDQTVTTNQLNNYSVTVPPNAVGVSIVITTNQDSYPFPTNLLIYAQISGYPDPVGNPGAIDITTSNNMLAIPPLTGGAISGIQALQNGGFDFSVGDSTNVSINYDLTIYIATTNTDGNAEQVLEGLNNGLAPYYRFETGTSMAAASISGFLALIQDYFTNTLHIAPSPALLKAMVINGARSIGGYTYAFTNGNNFQGWGLPNIQNSLPLASLTAANPVTGSSSPLFFVDQNPGNGLPTGMRHTYTVTVTNAAQSQPLQATLVWTDPPGDPNAAIKLVNSLTLVITNLDTGEVFIGNDISPEFDYNEPWNTNGPPNIDMINNVQNIFLSPAFEPLASSYSVTVVGRDVNVNAVTEQNTNVVQDYALVVSVGSAGEGVVSNAITSVTDDGVAGSLTSDQDVAFVTSTNAVLVNQFVGANTPLQGTNQVAIGTNTIYGTNGVLTIGMTNQWHFYVVTNDALDPAGQSVDVTNAAFLTFDAFELSVPRMGVYEEAVPTNATRPEADIDMYVTTDFTLTNLNPVAISNCLVGVNNGIVLSGASIGQLGTEYVYFTNTQPGQVFYVGIKSEDQMASEYDFLPVFTATPFSQLQPNGDEQVNGLLLPSYVPDGSPARPGITNVFALAIYPMVIENVAVTNLNQHQNFGDLIGTLTFGGSSAVLNNHDSFGDTYNTTIPLVYDDSAHPQLGSRHTDGPGNLLAFQTKSALGPWMLNEIDNSLTQTGQVSQFTLLITPHRDIKQPGITVSIPPGGWFVDYVTAPPGYTNLTFFATNLPPTIGPPPLQMYVKLNAEPTLTDFDYSAWLTNCLAGGTYPTGTDPGNSISIGPPLGIGNYFVGIYNPSATTTATVFISATLGIDTTSRDQYTYTASGPQPILGDGVTTSQGIFVGATQLVQSVNVGMVVQSPQISDMTFTLVSPTGQRILLMENRGAGTTNGAGTDFTFTNVLSSTATGGAAPATNYLTVSITGEPIPITYNFYTLPDEMTIYEGTNSADFYLGSPTFLYDTGFTNNPTGGNAIFTVDSKPGYTNVTIIMNQFGNTNSIDNSDQWWYTAGAAETNFEYLTFTDDTNLADVPIKYAVPPFSFTADVSYYVLSDFDLATNGLYRAPTNIFDAFGGWTLPTNVITYTTNLSLQVTTNVVILTNNYVSVATDPSTALGNSNGSNYLALAKGTITRMIPTVPGKQYNVTFWYRGPGIASWWRGEGNASDSSDPENNGNNGALVGQFNFPAGEVGQAFEFENFGDQFEFAGTNSYVDAPQSPSLDVSTAGGFTVEGWINPTNLLRPQPLVEWLAHVPTNSAVTNLVIKAGPYLNLATGHYYYLLGATDWITSEQWAVALGGHLATIDTANEQNWVFDNFARFGGFNRNLWLGLTNNLITTYGWSSGLTNFTYTNWLSGQPDNTCGTAQYTGMLGATNAQPGLWVIADDHGNTCVPITTNKFYGVAEVDQIQTNGVQFWISATNTPGTTNLAFANTNGCLYANIVDTNYVAHEIYSAPGLLQSNVFQHVALTYNTNSGLAVLYLNGTNVASTNLGVFVPKADGDVLLGRDMTAYTNNYYGGLMDEISIYRRALSPAEILAIYQASALTTNRNLGKFDPAVTPADGLAEAEVTFGTTSNFIFGVNNQWLLNSYTFTATTNEMPLQITGLQPGILLDDFAVSEAPVTNLYYLPEQSLDALTGDSAYGDWTLQIWDNLTGTAIAAPSVLQSWQLSFVLQSNATFSASLAPETPFSDTIAPGQTAYYQVQMPSWANEATNLLISSSVPVSVFFNPYTVPADAQSGNNLELINNSLGSPVLTGLNQAIAVNVTTTPLTPYQAGNTYYLGVQNPSTTTAADIVFQVNYDITPLTNGVPDTSVLKTNDTERYFSYTVSSNAYEATFQLLKLSGNADLVVRKGVPLPTLTNTDYGSFNDGNVDENIYVLTNSAPVPLSPGTWYVGVIKRDPGMVNYTVLAKELDATGGSFTNGVTIIPLTNGVPFNGVAVPGAALTNFFVFTVTNSVSGGVTNYVPGVHFQLYNLTGNGDLTVQTNALPLAPPFFQSSQSPLRNPESILVFTNGGLTNLAANWYLGVPNNEASNISYTIVAWIETNGYFPAFPGASGMGGGTVGAGHLGANSTVYHVISTNDSGPGTLRDAVNATNRTVVFDISGNIQLASPLVITNSYLTIAGQTAPGGGVTVDGSVTTVTNAHDVIIRDVRFRPAIAPTIVWQNGFEGYPTTIGDMTPPAYVDGWQIDSGSVDLYNATQSGWNAYQGSEWVDLNGDGPGEISTNIPTVVGQLYVLSFAYAPNPSSLSFGVLPEAAIFINNIYLNTVNAGSSAGEPPINWRIATYTFTATSSSTLLTFESTNTPGPCGVFLDAVSLSINATPTDALRFQNASNLIADHVSAEWSRNNLVSVLTSSNITVQWSILADNIYQAAVPGGYGSLLRYGAGDLSFNHDLYADNYNGNPRLGDNLSLDFVNNVLYNWGVNSGFSTNDVADNPGGFTNYLNYTCNYLIAGTNTLTNNIAFNGGTTNTWIFQTNNFIDGNTNALLDGANTGWTMFTNQFTESGQPFPLISVPTDEAYLAYEKVLDFAGVSMDKRDPVDTNVVYKVRTQTGTLINSTGVLPLYDSSTLPYLDTDQDGVPDFWEITFGQPPYVPSNNNASQNAFGYTTLEEYNNWLAAPHALTVTTNPVDVDLQQMFGQTGHLSFFVTNGVHGIVYLTNVLSGVLTNTGPLSNSVAVFTPTNNAGASTNYSGYASFDVYVTNTDTVAYFGPVTVSVLVSAVPISTNYNIPPVIVTLTNGIPYSSSNTVFSLNGRALTEPDVHTNGGGSDFYEFTVTNSLYASNVWFEVTNATGPVILLASYGLPLPSLSSYDYISSNSWTTSENIYVYSNSTPVALTNGDWYLAVVNVAGSNVTYNITATEFFAPVPPIYLYPTNTDVFTNMQTYLFTNQSVAVDPNVPPLSLTFALVSGPTNMTMSPIGFIDWTPTMEQGPTTNGPATNTIQVSVTNGKYTVTNTFTIIVMATNLLPVFDLTNIPPQYVNDPGTLTLTNAATNPNQPNYPLTYSLPGAPAGAVIDQNGVITWTTDPAEAGGDYVITTVVTDTNPFALNATSLSVTNMFEVYVIANLGGGSPHTNTVPTNGISWLLVNVPTNAIAATNTLVFATNLPVNVWFSTNVPPGITQTNDFELLTNSAGGFSVLTTNSTPTNIIPGGTYYLGVQNTNNLAVTYALEVNFLLSSIYTGPTTNTVPVTTGVFTNIDGTNGFLLTWFAPSNDLFLVQWTTNLAPVDWHTFTGIVSYNPAFFTSPTNTQFNYFDDGSQDGGFSAPHYYQLILLGSGFTNSTLTLPAQSNLVTGVFTPIVVTNTATDSNPSANLMYSLVSAPAGATISTNGIITWTPPASATNAPATFTTFVTDNGTPAVTAENTFTITVLAAPTIASQSFTTNGYLLTWYAPSNELFQVEWKTNLLSSSWNTFTNIISYDTSAFTSSTHTLFEFLDDGSQDGGLAIAHYYQLILLTSPAVLAGNVTLPAQSNLVTGVFTPIIVTNTATDSNPGATLTYTFASSPAGANISASGIITWTPPASATNAPATFTTIVKDNGTPAASATNSFTITVLAAPAIASQSFTTNGYQLTWYAPSNELFQVEWKTNLLSSSWNTFTNIISYDTSAFTSPTHTLFEFLDDGSHDGGLAIPHYYQLILLSSPALTATPLPAISSVVVTPTGATLKWSAPTNEQFEVLWTTNITPPQVWNPFPNFITSTTGTFVFTDTNVPSLMKFYELILAP